MIRNAWILLCAAIAVAFASTPALAAASARANDIAVEETTKDIRLRHAGAELVIEREPWRLRLQGADRGERFVEAAPPALQIAGAWQPLQKVTGVRRNGDAVLVDVALADGTPVRAEVRAFGDNGFQVRVSAVDAAVTALRGTTALRTIEEIYGFGEMWNGRVAQRGQALDLWARGGTPDECAYMPYYVSTNNYAFFLNYGGRVRFDVGRRESDRIVFEAATDEMDFVLVAGDSIATTVRNFLSVQGLPQRPPRWAFKPWFWLMSDPEQPAAKIDTLKGEHFIHMVDRLKALSIPVGVTWFEPPWQDARNTFVPNPEFSPDLPGLVRRLEEKGVRTLAWTVPYTTPDASNWKEAVERGYLVRKPGAAADNAKVNVTASGELEGRYYNMIDLFNPEAFAWWRAQIERSLETGIRGYKLDAGQDLPADALLHGGRRGAEVHNSYATEYSRVFFEALQKKYGDEFLMIPRAAWAGSSAFTNFKWPGDLSGSYANNGLPSTVYSTLSLAFSGFPFVSTDIGGFEDRPAPENVWLRWAQFGAMLPGMQTLHMPWWYSEESVTHFRYLAWLHTDLTPLWATLAREAAATGAPICRPLVWSNQDDIETWRVDDQFTVGESLLVAPMLNNNYDRGVYLPAGRWHDFWDNQETLVGPAHVTWFKGWFVKDKFPLYIKEGAIIPLEVTNEFSGFGWPESAGFVTLAIWPKVRGASAFTLHDTEDPVRIAAEWSSHDALTLRWSETRRNHLLRVHLDGTFAAAAVAAGSGTLERFDSLAAFRTGGEGWFHDRSTGKLWIRKFNSGQGDALTVRLQPTA